MTTNTKTKKVRFSTLFDIKVPANEDQILEIPAEPGKFTPPIDPDYKFYDRDLLSDILLFIMFGKKEGLYLTGPTGSGKTSIIRQVCARLNKNCISITAHGRMEMSELIINHVIKENESKLILGPLARSMKEGYIFIVNEIDTLDPATNTGFNDISDCLVIPETGQIIYPHEDFRLVACGNTVGGGDDSGYVGTTRQNLAFGDRFNFIEVNYPEPEVEIGILQKAADGNIPEELQEVIYDNMLKIAKETRQAFVNEEISLTFSTRTLLRWQTQFLMRHHKFLQVQKRTIEELLYYTFKRAILNRALQDPATYGFLDETFTKVFGKKA